MARIAHLSDIHFGAHDPRIVATAEVWLQQHRPDLVIISGDFTQRAMRNLFRQAAAWLNHPLFAMPIGWGNEYSEAAGRHEDAVRAAAQAGIHIALAGHFHRTYAEAAQEARA